MNAVIAVQFVNEIENNVRESYGLYKEGFVIVFYMKKMNVIGFKVIDENKSLINTKNDEDVLLRLNKLGQIESDYAKLLLRLAIDFEKTTEVLFNQLPNPEKIQIILTAIKEAYLANAHIPITLLGIN